MSHPEYCWSRTTYENIFGADPHRVVTLWQLDADGATYSKLESHDYAVGLTGIGDILADRKVRAWVSRYGARRNRSLEG